MTTWLDKTKCFNSIYDRYEDFWVATKLQKVCDLV